MIFLCVLLTFGFHDLVFGKCLWLLY